MDIINERVIKFRDVVTSFLKIGTIGFGGGSALIPVVEKEIVNDKQWIGEEDYNTTAIIANITPGALPVKLGAVWNSRFSVVSAYAAALPGVLALIVLLTAFSLIGEGAIRYIELASVGISAFIILLLYLYIKKVQDDGKGKGLYLPYLLIMLTAFLLTGGRELGHIATVLFGISQEQIPAPIFDISTIDLMIISFFSICFIASPKIKLRAVVALTISLLYALSKGKTGILSGLSGVLGATMAVLALGSILLGIVQSRGNRTKIHIESAPVKNIFIFVLIAGVLTCAPLLFAGDKLSLALEYAANVAISTVTSFGGGEAYVSVADGIFVQTGFVDPRIYYNQVVAAANALPGPILVKISSAVGYVMGASNGGILFGWLMAAIGISISVGVSSVAALLVYICFESVKESALLGRIKRYILPVICGMLISTILSILYEGLKVTVGVCGINPFLGMGFILLLFFGSLILHKRYHLNDIWLLLINGVITLSVLSLCH